MADLVASGTMAAVPMSPYGPSAYPSLPLQTRSLEIPRCSPRADGTGWVSCCTSATRGCWCWSLVPRIAARAATQVATRQFLRRPEDLLVLWAPGSCPRA